MTDIKLNYPQLSNATFMQYPIIQELATAKKWTVSDIEKRPVNAVRLLREQIVEPARLFDPIEYPLVSLLELNSNPQLDNVNRTYHLNADSNHTFMIDVEPSASEAVRQAAIDFPAHYTEISMNGGVHLLIKVPDELITPENDYLFKTTVIKTEDKTIEYILNNHYCTFTKKIVTNKPIADFIYNTEDRNKLETLLADIVEMDRENKRLRELKAQNKININTENLNIDAINKILKTGIIRAGIEKQKEKQLSDYNNDDSSYEWNIAMGCVGYLRQKIKYLKTTIHFKDIVETLTEDDLIYLVYEMMLQVIPPREKHTQTRHGMPLLLDGATNAWGYIQQQNKIQKKEQT